MKWLNSSFSLLLFLFATSVFAQRTPVGALYHRAVVQLRTGELAKAKETLSNLLNQRKDELSKKQQGAIFGRLNQIKRIETLDKNTAEKEFAEALKICHQADPLIFNRKYGKKALASIKKLIPRLEGAAFHLKEDPAFHILMAYCLLFSGRSEAAKPSIRKFAELKPGSVSNHNLLAMLHRLKGKRKKEQEELESSLTINADQPDISFWLARLLLMKKKRSDYGRAFSLALASIDGAPERSLFWSNVFKSKVHQRQIDDKAAEARANLALLSKKKRSIETTGLLEVRALDKAAERIENKFISIRKNPTAKVNTGPPDAEPAQATSTKGGYDSLSGGNPSSGNKGFDGKHVEKRHIKRIGAGR